MTTTLVLGDGTRSAFSYGGWLLEDHGDYNTMDAGQAGLHLAGALLSSRLPVLLHNIEGWVDLLLQDPSIANPPDSVEARLSVYVDELVVARRHVPVDVLTVSKAAEWGPAQGLAYVNSRLSASSDHVHVLIAGRVLDLSSAAVAGQV